MMYELSATLKLRPARIALLTRPNDMSAIRKFMRISACLWGGAYNPIIPVMNSVPATWRDRHGLRLNARNMTRGYIRYFEPDAYVEAEEGLLEAAGLAAFRRQHAIHPRVLSLGRLMAKRDNQDWAEPSFGLSVLDAMRDIHSRELRFEMKQARKAIIVKPQSGSLLTEVMFGCYPGGKLVDYFRKNYCSAFEAEQLVATPDAWLAVFQKGDLTPLRFTRYKIEPELGWRDTLTLFVFDPSSPLDCIDLWNMRSQPGSVLPVPLDWWSPILSELRNALRREHRPIKGNPFGSMHRGTLEFARSIDPDRATAMASEMAGDLDKGSMSVRHWPRPVWRVGDHDQRPRDNSPQVFKAAEKRINLSLDKASLAASFETLSPEFADKYGSNDLRWVNTIQPLNFYGDYVGTTLPFNTFDPYFTMIQGFGDPVLIGREGWTLGQRYKDLSARLTIPTPEAAVISALKRHGIEARLSEPGHIAKQILGHLKGLRGVQLLADPETLDMLNTMAGGIRRKGSGETETEELFDRRSKPVRDWHSLVERRKAQGFGISGLEDFTGSGVIRLGLQSRCPTCANLNWHTLTAVDYDVICERCQRSYPFPQAGLQKNNGNWSFRVIGPFAVPDYARGSYGALLALRAISTMDMGHDSMSYSTALSLSFDGIDAEADFVALRSPERHGSQSDPELIICEAKSFGTGQLIAAKDLAKLRAIAKKIEGAVIVISVLRDRFHPEELKLLGPFVKWCRQPDKRGGMRNPVILLTGHETFCHFDIGMTWKQLGGEYAKFEDYRHRDNLRAFADATQAIHLGLKPHQTEMFEKWEAKRASKTLATLE
ncbi:hypothetical protein HL653_05900 [Sphingomonas sp. AP4-R1]|uniref:hypothetical protein n=1 Tax=Sphingomonas sp. AP4-R1 TaxID=2735134 RepID=UPI001493766B|nr:hypothetical protein [Sphingomonas sp. AP4-R1]QJU57385.1 hypothetical protein HL653_05900 [Sphingomonas sp. AP4-R1]